MRKNILSPNKSGASGACADNLYQALFRERAWVRGYLYVSEVLKPPRVTKIYSSLTLGTKGYGSRFVVRSFTRSFILFTALQRAALTSSRQVRYEQAKHVDGLQSDSWILL